MDTNIYTLIGEATAFDKKQMLEVRHPKSWLKSVSAFANGEGGTLIFGIRDDDQIVGLADAKGDAEKISEEIKSKLDPIPVVNLDLKEVEGKNLVLLHVYPGQGNSILLYWRQTAIGICKGWERIRCGKSHSIEDSCFKRCRTHIRQSSIQ